MHDKIELMTEIIKSYDDDIIETISNLEPLFPIKIQDNKDKIASNLSEPNNINIFLKYEKQIVGYLLATPQNDAVKDLINDDPKMREDDKRYYIDKIVVLPEYRAGSAFLAMIDTLLIEAGARGINRISSHVLADNGLNKSIKKIFKKYLTETRVTNLEMHDNAFFVYFEFTYSDKYIIN